MDGAGILSDVRVATPRGWRAAGRLRAGDMVLTLDDGMQPLTGVLRQGWPATVSAAPVWPLRVPPGVLGNRRALDLAPGQGVAVECDAAEALSGAPLALVPVAALAGWRGIAPVAPQGDRLVLRLALPGIVYAEGAALIGCGAPVLPLPQARHLAACLMAGDVGTALAGAGC